MKPIKMFGLAMLAALLAMAFVGSSSAMAEYTGLCSEDREKCPEITHVHETSVGKAKLLNSVKTVECDALFLGDVTEGAPAIIKGNFSYSNCNSGCSVTEVSEYSTLKILRESHETASLVGEGEMHVTCSGINCYYNGEGLKGTGTGALLSTQENGEVSISEQTAHKTKGLLCPSTAKLDITTTPSIKTYIATAGICVSFQGGRYKDSSCTLLGPSFSYRLFFDA
jgi:hypothetical protein